MTSRGRALLLAATLAAGPVWTVRAQTPAPAPPVTPITEGMAAYQSAMDAWRRRDLPGYRLALRVADRLLPRQPVLARRLAGAAAALGDTADAIGWLDRLAAFEVRMNLDADSLLAPLRSRPEYAALKTRMAGLDAPRTSSEVAAELPDKGLITEGIAWDEAGGRFFIGSVRRRTVLALDRNRRLTEFTAAGRDSLLAPLGLVVDPERGCLWAVTAAVPEMAGFDSTFDGRTELVRIGLADGRVMKRWRPPADGVTHSLNDLTLDERGNLFLSDSQGGAIYRLGGEEEDGLELFLPAGAFGSPNGLAPSPSGRELFVADYGLGLFVVDLVSRLVTPVAAPADLCLNGIDGLIAIPGGLVAIQNGILPNRILRLTLEPGSVRIARGLVLDRNHPEWDEPTLGVRLGSEVFYVARSQWSRMRPGGRLPPLEELERPLVMRVRVE